MLVDRDTENVVKNITIKLKSKRNYGGIRCHMICVIGLSLVKKIPFDYYGCISTRSYFSV